MNHSYEHRRLCATKAPFANSRAGFKKYLKKPMLMQIYRNFTFL